MTTKEEFKLKAETSYTSKFMRTEEVAIRDANSCTKASGRYFTTIKVPVVKGKNTDKCWVITDRYSRRLK